MRKLTMLIIIIADELLHVYTTNDGCRAKVSLLT